LQAIERSNVAEFTKRHELKSAQVRFHEVLTHSGGIGAFMRSNQREIERSDLAPYHFVTTLRFKRMVKLTERDQIARRMRTAIRNRLHVMCVQF